MKLYHRIAEPALLAGVSLAVVAMSGAAHAQSTKPEAAQNPDNVQNNDGIQDIIVTAQRRESSVQRTPLAVAALDASALNDNHVSDVRNLTNFVPNVSVSSNTGVEFPIAIRGISSSVGGIGADSPTAVYIDGVYIARAFGTVFDFVDTERVEVLRGPQGTLYGRNSTAGAISVITRRPTATPTADISVDGGSYNLVRATAAVRGPLLGDKLLASIAGAYTYRDGFYTDTTTGDKHLNRDNSWQLKGALAFNPDGKLSADIRADYSRFEIPVVTKELTGIFGAPPFTPDTADILTANHPGKSFATSGGISATITYDLDWAVLKSITAFRGVKVNTTNDVDSSAISFQRVALGPERQHQLSQELQLSSSNWSRGSYVLGLYAFGENAKTRAIFEQFDAPTPFGLADLFFNSSAKIRDRNLAAFGQVDYQLTDRIIATIGARYTWEQKKFDFGQGMAAVPSPAIKPEQIDVFPELLNGYDIHKQDSYKAFTPKFGLSWQADRDIFLYVNAQRGFKSGGFSFLDGSSPGFGPEKIWAYEGGIKTTLFDRKLTFNLTGFYYKYSDLQVTLAGAPGVRFTANAANSTIKGAEVEVTAQPIRGLRLSGFGSILDAKYKDYVQDLTLQNAGGVPLFISCPGGTPQNGTQQCNLSGNYLPRAPKWSYTLSASYEFQGSGFSLTPQVTWHHEANTFYSEQNIAPLQSGGVQNLSARITLGLGKNLRIALYGDNLTDYRYVMGATTVPPGIAGFSNWPRTFGGQLAFTY